MRGRSASWGLALLIVGAMHGQLNASSETAAGTGRAEIESAAGAGSYAINWYTIDSGGGTSAIGSFSLSGTIGQVDAGDLTDDGGVFVLRGGFWPGARTVVGVSCFGDLDLDGEIGFGDLLAVLSTWGTCGGCAEDLSGDGVVGFDDLLVILSDWGPCS